MEPLKRRNEVLKRIQDANQGVLNKAIKEANKLLNEVMTFPVKVPLTGVKEVDTLLVEMLRKADWKINQYNNSTGTNLDVRSSNDGSFWVEVE